MCSIAGIIQPQSMTAACGMTRRPCWLTAAPQNRAGGTAQHTLHPPRSLGNLRIQFPFCISACKTANSWHIKDSFKTDGRNAYATCGLATHAANITGQLRQVTLGSVGYAGIRFTRMPAFFYRRNLIRMMMTIEMIAIQILIGLHLLIAQSEFICPKGATPCNGWATTNDALIEFKA